MTSRKTGVTRGTCEQMTALIDTLGRDGHDASLVQRIVEHLAECAACGKSEAGLVELLAQYRRQRLLPLPPDLEQRLLDRVCLDFASGE